MELMNRPLDSPEFDNTQFVSLAEQQDYEQQVKQAIAEMPIDPEQCAQDMAAICEIQLKIYDQLVAKRKAEWICQIYFPTLKCIFAFVSGGRKR